MTKKAEEETGVKTEIITATEGTERSALTVRGQSEFDPNDIDVPKLNIIQKMSQIEGDLGSVVIDKDAMIIPASTKTLVVPMAACKKWHEEIPFDEGQMPRIANTEEEREKLALESDYPVGPYADVVLLIPEHEHADPDVFPYPIGDKNYAIGLLMVQKQAFRQVYKRLNTFKMFNVGVPFYSVYWKFESALVTSGKYQWFAPSITVTKEAVPKAVQTFIEQLGG